MTEPVFCSFTVEAQGKPVGFTLPQSQLRRASSLARGGSFYLLHTFLIRCISSTRILWEGSAMKKLCAMLLLLTSCLFLLPVSAAGAETNAKAVLLMEKTTGEVLYEENSHDTLEPASVTKVMYFTISRKLCFINIFFILI